ncbi:helix-turn-helix transcriptional regulator [uncultured Cohaesibacter sp.]|uniref:helix-turn-helix domain-containing protein n=1 Tax=uncultured Cohaesibacter sp. TaxID=1002546 RepID=UPI00292D0834|nr:helix-turn-helix transcriptional regulator [uncultured Cohaesibacter sp.]
MTVPKAQQKIRERLKTRRLELGFTQEGLANRAGVSLPTLRRFEQKGVISLEAFLKLAMVLNALEPFVEAIQPSKPTFSSIDDVLTDKKAKPRKTGWRS